MCVQIDFENDISIMSSLVFSHLILFLITIKYENVKNRLATLH